jgi:hypothetical protein
MAYVVDRRDDRWNDAVWRTETLLLLMADNGLTVPEVAKYLRRRPSTVSHWRSGSHFAIPRDTLRLLMLELALGGKNAIQ